jgi:hypothetical protein
MDNVQNCDSYKNIIAGMARSESSMTDSSPAKTKGIIFPKTSELIFTLKVAINYDSQLFCTLLNQH